MDVAGIMLHSGWLSEFAEFPASRELDARARGFLIPSFPSFGSSLRLTVGALDCWVFRFLELVSGSVAPYVSPGVVPVSSFQYSLEALRR